MRAPETAFVRTEDWFKRVFTKEDEDRVFQWLASNPDLGVYYRRARF